MLKDFKYKLTGVALVTHNISIFKIIYTKYKDALKNGCVYDEFLNFTIRLDFKNGAVYVYSVYEEGIVFEDLLDFVCELSNFDGGTYSDMDWDVLRKDYEISFTTDYHCEFHTQDGGLSVHIDEDGRIHLRRSKLVGEDIFDCNKLDGIIAPVITDVKNLFGPDFEGTENTILIREFDRIVDEIFREEVRIGERGCGEG